LASRSVRRIRPAEARDYDGINSLLQAAGLPKRSRRGFDWLLRDNPGQSGVPAGWVAEDGEGHIAAFLGNFVQRAWLNGRSCLTASAHSFVTARGQPGRALTLLRHFVNQDDAALLNGLNAGADSAWIYDILGYPPYPDTGSLRLSWATGPTAQAGNFPRLSTLTRLLPEPRYRWPAVGDAIAASGQDVSQIVVPLGNARLADFDSALRQGARLFAERSPETLYWRLTHPDAGVAPILISYPADGQIEGLALLQFNKPSRGEPPCLDIIDLVTLDPKHRSAVQALLQAGLSIAREGGAARMRLNLVTQPLLAMIGPMIDSADKHVGSSPHAYYRFNIDMPEPLARYWQPLPYDADHGLGLRAMPVRG
jgi:hypothetical protein